MTLGARKKPERSEKCHHLRRKKLKSLHIFCGRLYGVRLTNERGVVK